MRPFPSLLRFESAVWCRDAKSLSMVLVMMVRAVGLGPMGSGCKFIVRGGRVGADGGVCN